MMVEQHEQGLAKISDLKGAEYNPRIMPDAEMKNLMQSLREFGFVQPIAARKEDGLILGGHQRVEAMKRIVAEAGGDPDVRIPVIWIAGLTDEKAKLLNVALNRIHGEWDFEKLGTLFESLTPTMPTTELAGSGFSGKEIEDIIKLTATASEEVAPAPAPVVTPAASTKFTFELGAADAAEVKAALTAHGMTNGKTAGAALLKLARAATAHVVCERELCS